MKKYIFLISVLLIFAIVACDKDSLGIEENLIVKPIDTIPIDSIEKPDTSKKEIKTKFRSDSISIKFSEKILFVSGGDTVVTRWTPLIFDAYAILDTAKLPRFDKLYITAQRNKEDELEPYRKEVILGFNLELDTFKLVREYISFQNNRIYNSSLHLYMVQDKIVKTLLGEYPIELRFSEMKKEDNFIYITGKFVINVPTFHQSKKYDYLFIGEMNFRFKLED